MAVNGEVAVESAQESAAISSTGDSGINQALVECWSGGPIVSNPKDCHDIDRNVELDQMGFPSIDTASFSSTDRDKDSISVRPLDGNPTLNPNDSWTDPQKDS